MQIALDLLAVGVKVVPGGNKVPAVRGWQSPLHPDRYEWRTESFCVPTPPGIMFIDLDPYKDGAASKRDIEAYLGTPLDWDAALLQYTPRNGEHYAFRTDFDVVQGADVGKLIGFDTRGQAARGYIFSGPTYKPAGFGLFKLGQPAHLPALPDACRHALERKTVTIQNIELPQDSLQVDVIRDALNYIDPGDRDTWFRVGCAIHFEFHDQHDIGFTLFDEFSQGMYGDWDVPEGYNAETQEQQYASMSPHNVTGALVTPGTLFALAQDGGYVKVARIDSADAFGSGVEAPEDDYRATLTAIEEYGIDPERTPELVRDIHQGAWSPIQRAALMGALERTLIEGGFSKKAVAAMLGDDLPKVKAPEGPEAEHEELVDVEGIRRRALGRPESSHGMNAKSMVREVFGDRLCKDDGTLRWWSGRCWQRMPADTLEGLIWEALDGPKALATNVAGTRKALGFAVGTVPHRIIDKRVYFLNGILDLDAPQANGLRAHDRENGNIGTLSVDFDPTAHCREWLQFLDSIFGGEEDGAERVLLLQEMMGWCVLGCDFNLQKVLTFDGASRGGKGTILDVLTALLGGDSCGSFTFANLYDGKTQSSFMDRDVMFDSEAKPPARQNIPAATAFLNKVASNESVAVQLLNTQSPWEGSLNTKVVISCNGVPTMTDDSGASANRFMILKFTRSFEHNPDRELGGRLRKELPGIALWVLNGAARLISTKGTFTVPTTTADARTDLKENTQPLLDFITDHIVFDANGRTHSKPLYRAYHDWALTVGINPRPMRAFLASFKQTTQSKGVVYKKSLRIGKDDPTTGFTGFALTTPALAFAAPTTQEHTT